MKKTICYILIFSTFLFIFDTVNSYVFIKNETNYKIIATIYTRKRFPCSAFSKLQKYVKIKPLRMVFIDDTYTTDDVGLYGQETFYLHIIKLTINDKTFTQINNSIYLRDIFTDVLFTITRDQERNKIHVSREDKI